MTPNEMPLEIWIEPKCCADTQIGQVWCDHDAWICDDGKAATKYLRATPDQQRVADHLNEITKGQIGAGDDPIGFLMASHSVLALQRKHADVLANAVWRYATGIYKITVTYVDKSLEFNTFESDGADLKVALEQYQEARGK